MISEFSLIETYFKAISPSRSDVLEGIGDDAACLRVPPTHDLVVSTDTLVSGVHFFHEADPFDLAIKLVGVNVSDMMAVGAIPAWVTLALTLPEPDETWLFRFSKGLAFALSHYQIALVGGDTTRGSLCLTLTIHGLVERGQFIRRGGAQVGDTIYVTSELGLPACALSMRHSTAIPPAEFAEMQSRLNRPMPRLAWVPLLTQFATAAIDISDGLSADLSHVCEASGVGAILRREAIPIHPLVRRYQPDSAMAYALSGGDEYELAFTVSAEKEPAFLKAVKQAALSCFPVGVIESLPGLRLSDPSGECFSLAPQGYNHFQ